ncbi:hypothetical protein [Sediminibacillus sp. JSM 1682029]|uniref:hypothetical protein n=1 Tax=Sediminibacillus sp. JSM 1682029 TaxID=3229857 RepID=UPI003525934C
MENLFTPSSRVKINAIESLQNSADNLLQQKKLLGRKDDVLKNSYTLTINEVLESIQRVASKIENPETEVSGEIGK